MQKKQATVVGAGLVGSLWAIYLMRRGYTVDVFERRPDMRQAGYSGGRSINLAMSNRGWKALERVGLADTIREQAIPMRGRMMHSVEGKLTFQPYGLEDQAIYSVSRGRLNLQLLEAASHSSQVRFHFNEICQRLDVNRNLLEFENLESGRVTEIESPLIFGTDGAFSAVRTALSRLPRYDYSQEYLTHGYKELTIPPTASGDFAMDPYALHIWPRGSFMLIALPNYDKSFTCTLFLPFEGEEGFDRLQDEASVQAFFEKYFSDSIPLITQLHEEFRDNPTSALVTVRCKPWQYNRRILLLGDAAHAIVPFYGQGMNAGFEDCTILDDLLEKTAENWDQAIEIFDRTRVADGNAVANLALRNFIEMRDLVADPKFLLRKKIEGHLHKTWPEAFIPLYSQVSFSEIPYHRAWQEGLDQDALFEEILAIPGVKEKWDSPEVEAVFKSWLTKNNR